MTSHFVKQVFLIVGGRLKITPGVTLKFEHSIGMMIAGEIIAEGDLKGGDQTHFLISVFNLEYTLIQRFYIFLKIWLFILEIRFYNFL